MNRALTFLPSGAAIHLAIAILALAAAVEPALPGGTFSKASPQLARASQTYRSHWKDTSDDKGEELDKPISRSQKSTAGGTYKTGSDGYSPQRVQRFWSHYHGARPGPKEKPLERQPGEAATRPRAK